MSLYPPLTDKTQCITYPHSFRGFCGKDLCGIEWMWKIEKESIISLNMTVFLSAYIFITIPKIIETFSDLAQDSIEYVVEGHELQKFSPF